MPGGAPDRPIPPDRGTRAGWVRLAGAGALDGEGGGDDPTVSERELAALARSQAPLRVALAAVAARLAETRAWERLGFARLADYARERAGLSARQLQELACTSRRLEALPAVAAALAAGRIPWTKARLVARVATPTDETPWLALAQALPADALERRVRAVDRGSVEAGALAAAPEADGAEPERNYESVVLRCTRRTRTKLHRARQLARRVAGEHLPMWACMEAVAAEALSAIGLEAGDEDVRGDPPAAPDAAEEPGPGASWPTGRAGAESGRRGTREEDAICEEHAIAAARAARPAPHAPSSAHAPHLPCAVRALTEGLEAADAFALDARLRRAVVLAQRLEAAMAPRLRAVAEARLHRARGFRTLAAYARGRLGLSPRKARALLRLDRAATRCPALRAAFAEGALSWVQAQALLPVLVLPEAAGFRTAWVEHARGVTVRRLEDDVDRALHRLEVDPEGFRPTGGLPGPCEEGAGSTGDDDAFAERQIRARDRDPAGGTGPHAGPDPELDPHASRYASPHASPDPDRDFEPETARFFFRAPPEVARLFHAVVCSVRRHLERLKGPEGLSRAQATPGAAVDWMLDHAFATWGADDPRVPRAHRVFARDGWRCTVPGCSSYRNLHDHHVVFRSAGGSDALANRTTLCAFHHLRGVHAGRVRCKGHAPGGLRFELGLRPGRPPLLRYAPGERRAGLSARRPAP